MTWPNPTNYLLLTQTYISKLFYASKCEKNNHIIDLMMFQNEFDLE